MKDHYQSMALSYVVYTLQRIFFLRRVSKSGLIEAISERINPTVGSTTPPTTTPGSTAPGRLKMILQFLKKLPRQLITKIENGWMKSWAYVKKIKLWKIKRPKFWTLFTLLCITIVIVSLLHEFGYIR
ncbi:MAG: hypothetical protein UT48_C0046G0007 [Parcubacteria group bacterium GW2011_GWE2_39_37]|nr:MAG: hypothetical protein UT48_C0046G0007 [Parcubacteria group bacterium GW2011_GWE2_39_37]